jgi:hypothetical protein
MLALTAGAVMLAALFAPPASAPPGRALVFLFFVGSSGHVASTGWLFTLREVRAYAVNRPLRYMVAPAVLVLLGALSAALLRPSQLDWLLLAFFAWQFFHFQKQNLGMAALVASTVNVRPLKRCERRAIVAAGAVGIAGLMASPELLQLKLHERDTGLFTLSAVAFGTVAVVGTAMLLHRPASERPPTFCAAFLAALLFFSPVFVFGSPYAAVGGMTIAHGMQYLLLVGLIAGGKARDGRRSIGLATLCNVALLGGLALSCASHLHGAPAPERSLFGAYLGVVMAHFVVDAGLWRLRDPFPRAFLSSHLPYLVEAPFVPPADRSAADIG